MKVKKRREREDFIACLVSLQLRSLYILFYEKQERIIAVFLFLFVTFLYSLK